MTTLDPAADPGLERDTSSLFADLAILHKLALEFISEAQVYPSGKVNKRAASLFTRIIELAGSCLTLHSARCFTAVPIIARSSVEALADLLALHKNPAHVDSMNLRDLEQHHRFWTDDDALQSDSVKKGMEHPTAAEDLEWIKTSREALQGATWSVKGIFKAAGLEQIYAVQYNRLCIEAHNNSSSLYERHVAIDPVSGEKVPAYLKYPTIATELGMGTARACLEIAMGTFAEMFGKLDLLRSLDKGAPV